MEAQAEPPRLSPVALIGSYFYAESVAPLSSAGAGVITTTPHKNVLQIMRPAARFRDRPSFSIWRVERVESRIGIGLENPAITGEMLLGMDASAIR